MKFLLRIVPVTLVMGAIFFLSHQAGDTLPLPSFPGADKLAHMTAYAVLALSFLWFLGAQGNRYPARAVVLTILFCFLYGISDEYHQSFVEQRMVSGFDLLADTAGALLLSLFWGKNASLRTKLIFYQDTVAGKCRAVTTERD